MPLSPTSTATPSSAGKPRRSMRRRTRRSRRSARGGQEGQGEAQGGGQEGQGEAPGGALGGGQEGQRGRTDLLQARSAESSERRCGFDAQGEGCSRPQVHGGAGQLLVIL
eukprot:1038182-Heterocapsa_arctica.AAC.1